MQSGRHQDTSSFQSLPVEIISKIFLDGTQNWRDFEPQAIPFPVLVSAVCSHWCNVSEGMPELWSTILPPLHKELDECLDWTSKWLDRSGTTLVSVVLDVMSITTELEGAITAAIEQKIAKTLALLSKHPHRLRRLDIRSVSLGAFKKFIRDLWDAPNLDQLSLCSQKSVGLGYFFLPNEEHLKWSVLHRLTSLRKFRFQNISPPCISSLTSLTAYRLMLNYEGIKTLFTGSPSLVHLVLHDLPPVAPREEPAHCKSLSAPSLRSLAVEVSKWYRDETDSFYLFGFLHLPNLVSLEIRGDIPSINNLFGSSLSSATIKKLRLSNINQLPDDGVKFFQLLSNLEELEISETPTWKLYPHIQSISDDDSDQDRTLATFPTTVWPHLCSITLDTSDLNSLLSSLDFIEVRSGEPHLKMQKLYLSHSTMRLLAEGDVASEDHPRFMSKFGNDGGKQWVENLVEVRLLKYIPYGLLDGDRVPLAEML